MADAVLSGQLLRDPNLQVAVAKIVATSDLILDITEGDLLESLIVEEGEQDA